MASADPSPDALKSTVRDKYAALATDDDSCCDSSGDGETGLDVDMSEEYSEAIAADADLDLGCGRPTDHADLQPGEQLLRAGRHLGHRHVRRYSGAALAAVVGVLVEVPVMLALVRIANATRPQFEARTAAA